MIIYFLINYTHIRDINFKFKKSKCKCKIQSYLEFYDIVKFVHETKPKHIFILNYYLLKFGT